MKLLSFVFLGTLSSWTTFWIGTLSLWTTSFVEAKGKKCAGHFGSKLNVANLCESHFPDAKSEKIWFVKFYAPWCGHCNNMKPDWITLGKELKDDPIIQIGGVDCDDSSNKGLCGKYGVQGFPTIKAIINGKAKNYQGGRDKESMKLWILQLKEKRGSKGGSSKCERGIFKSSIKDAILPLCSKHFPDNKSKNSWVITYYKKKDIDFKSDDFNKLAIDFGQMPIDMNKQKKKSNEKKQKDRLIELKDRYYNNIGNSSVINITDGKRKVGKSIDPLAKFGAVCCDCNEKEFDEKCKNLKLPAYSVFNHVSKKTINFEGEPSRESLGAFILEKLELVVANKKGSSGEKKEEKKTDKKEQKQKKTDKTEEL